MMSGPEWRSPALWPCPIGWLGHAHQIRTAHELSRAALQRICRSALNSSGPLVALAPISDHGIGELVCIGNAAWPTAAANDHEASAMSARPTRNFFSAVRWVTNWARLFGQFIELTVRFL